MSPASQLDDSREQRLEQALADYLRSIEAGHPVDRNAMLARYPDLADELQSFFCNRDAMQDLARPLQDMAGKIAAGEELTIVQGSGEQTAPPAGPRVRYFGDYELLSEIARGGMGVVYKARQESLKRTVALKMILSGQLASAEDVSRFRQEAEAAANLDHPHIVPIYEIGEHEGQHYFSMRLIESGNLAQLLSVRKAGLPVRRAARMVATAARAVHHAHQRGLLHRDLKPSNILIDVDDEPQVTDFGLARRVDGDSDLTRSGAAVGTPSYMAPEQARAQKQISTAADVYSLGAVLYETLTGQPPFQGETAVDTIMQVLSREPKRPRLLNPRIDRDLETICLRCLEKEPQRRYDSAAALADDLDRWSRGEPILARPAGKMERMLKWARRHPSVAALAALLLLVCFVGFCLVTWKWHEASMRADAETKALEAARQTLERSQQFAFTAQLWRAAGLIDSDPASAAKALDDIEFCPPDRRDFAWRYCRQLSDRLVRRLTPNDKDMGRAVMTRDGIRFAALTSTNQFLVWNIAADKREALLPGHGHNLQSLAFSPDGKVLATGGADGLVKLWEVPAGKLVATLTWKLPDAVPRHVMFLTFSPDGRSLAAGGGFLDPEKLKHDRDGRWRKPVVWIWDVASRTGKLLTSMPRLTGHAMGDSGVNYLAYSPDGKTLALGLTRESSVVLVDAQTGDEQQRFHTEAGWIGGVAFSSDGKLLAYGNSTYNVFLCDLAARKVRHRLTGHLDHVDCILFAPDGTLVTGAYDGNVRMWDADSGRLRTTFRCEAKIKGLGLLPGARQLFVNTERDAQIWSLDGHAAPTRLRAPKDSSTGNSSLAFDEAGALLAVAGQDDVVRVWDVGKRAVVRELAGHKGRLTTVAFGPSGSDLLVSGGEDKQVLLWRLQGRDPLKPVTLAGHTAAVTCLAITPDGSLVVSGSLDGTLRFWGTGDGTLVRTIITSDPQIRSLALSGDGQRLLTGGQDGSLRVWDMRESRRIEKFPPRVKAPIEQIAISSDGQTAATIQNRTVAFYDLNRKGEARQSQISGAMSVAFTPDGKSLAVGGNDRIVRLYDVASGHFRAELPGHSHEVMGLAFNRDATVLASSSRGELRWDKNGEVLLWAAPVHGEESR